MRSSARTQEGERASRAGRARARARTVVALLGSLGSLGTLGAGACATQEMPAFSDGVCVAAGCASTAASGAGSASSSSGVPCTVDQACPVSFGADIFTGIIDGPAACTAAACHGTGLGGITLQSGKPHGAYLALTGYTLLPSPGPAKPYIVACSPALSGFPCNVAESGTNAFGTCGVTMPFGSTGQKLTMDQVTKIADWITCGAPEN